MQCGLVCCHCLERRTSSRHGCAGHSQPELTLLRLLGAWAIYGPAVMAASGPDTWRAVLTLRKRTASGGDGGGALLSRYRSCDGMRVESTVSSMDRLPLTMHMHVRLLGAAGTEAVAGVFQLAGVLLPERVQRSLNSSEHDGITVAATAHSAI